MTRPSVHCEHRKTCIFSGRVQGVGFRYTVKNLALRYAVYGYVRNLPDGRVELVIEGPDKEMDHLVKDVTHKFDGYIRDIDASLLPATGEFTSCQSPQFAIRH